jgi:hypothetical protein
MVINVHDVVERLFAIVWLNDFGKTNSAEQFPESRTDINAIFVRNGTKKYKPSTTINDP